MINKIMKFTLKIAVNLLMFIESFVLSVLLVSPFLCLAYGITEALAIKLPFTFLFFWLLTCAIAAIPIYIKIELKAHSYK